MATKIYGRNPVIEALEGTADVEKVYLVDGLKGEYELQIRTLCEEHNVPLSRIPHKKLDNLAKGGNHQGVMAELAFVDYWELDALVEKLEEKPNATIVMLDGVTDVRNMGAIARSAKVFGIDGIIIATQGNAKINSHMVKASSGAILELPVSRVASILSAMETLQMNDYRVLASDLKAENSLANTDLNNKIAIVLGSEDKGIGKKTAKVADETFKIDQASQFDSLNVSVAAGVIFHEIFNKRK